VFWWPDALPVPPWEQNNLVVLLNNPGHFSNVEGDTNVVDISGNPVAIKNRPLYHHFKPLSDFLGNSNLQDYQFFGDVLIPRRVPQHYTDPNELESYYLVNAQQSMAVGWVHSRNAWVMNNYYLNSASQNFLGCDAPDPATSRYLHLPGFNSGLDYYITWFPTHLNSEVTPPSPPDPIPNTTDPDNYIRIHNGTITIDLLDQFGGLANNYLDTLRSDYAFVIAPAPMSKSRPTHAAEPLIETKWDFTMYPNPTRDALFLRFADDGPKAITLCDLSGREVERWSGVTSMVQTLHVDHLAKGVYAVIVSDDVHSRTKKLIIL